MAANRGLIEEAYRIAIEKTGHERSHGSPHFSRVHEAVRNYGPGLPIDSDVLDILEYTSPLHDIGMAEPGDHVANSVRMIKELFRGELCEMPFKEEILYAVGNHTRTADIKMKAKNESMWLAARLLPCFDHLDSIGEAGIERAESICRGFYPEEGVTPSFKNTLRRCLCADEKSAQCWLEDARSIRKICQIGYLAHKHLLTFIVTDKDIMPYIYDTSLLEEIWRRNKVTFDFVAEKVELNVY